MSRLQGTGSMLWVFYVRSKNKREQLSIFYFETNNNSVQYWWLQNPLVFLWKDSQTMMSFSSINSALHICTSVKLRFGLIYYWMGGNPLENTAVWHFIFSCWLIFLCFTALKWKPIWALVLLYKYFVFISICSGLLTACKHLTYQFVTHHSQFHITSFSLCFAL